MHQRDDPTFAEEDPAEALIATFTRTAQALFSAGGVEATLQAVVDLAVATLEGCDYAGIFVSRSRGVATAVRTDELVGNADALQIEAGEGPCLDAIAQGAPCYAEDLADDPRWPRFGPAAAAAGIRCLLALHLSDDGTFGALGLYARYPSAFGAVDRAKGLILAGLAGLALVLARTHDRNAVREENLHQALATRALIGQAQGILMERERVTAEQAFSILRQASQHLNIKLREVAQSLVDTGERPRTGLPPTA